MSDTEGSIAAVIAIFLGISLYILTEYYIHYRVESRCELFMKHLDNINNKFVVFKEEMKSENISRIKRDEIIDLQRKYGSLLSKFSKISFNCEVFKQKIKELDEEIVCVDDIKMKIANLISALWGDQKDIKDELNKIRLLIEKKQS